MPLPRRLAVLCIAALAAFGTTGAGQPTAQQDVGTEAARLHASLRNYISARWSPPDGETRYRVAFIDLNDDGRREAVVLMDGDFWCGSAGVRSGF